MNRNKLLIVDDSVLVRKVIERIFSEDESVKGSLDILGAGDGESAVTVATEQKPDVILLDVVLPDKTGYEICAEFKSNSELADIPVIFITSRASDDDIAKAFEVGAVDYVQKPFRPFELIARVKTHLDMKKAKDALIAANSMLSVALAEKEKLAICDPLTGLYNRRYMNQRFLEEINRTGKDHSTFCIIMGDIDHFKQVNDVYGHEAGDAVLTSVAHIMDERCRKADTISRWGGEEFLILCPQTDKSMAQLLAEDIRNAIEQSKVTVNEQDIEVTISLGVAEYDSRKTVSQNVAKADKALYDAKHNGRNQVVLA